ncbi:uncharacterized protein MONBRDRAFT_7332 [Monosiga brevicollis MX1]|uniref:Fragile site-associated protein C-terminal domain-containing protein n=1 Tax=Monosiga brevicollis TaxID=81824 RepID=A9UWM9_MONBE|nr:uncharacterized protein MONBRDRAFT_7332 [Monosiga brevicollis MX1]EDQ90241.1 predicted protein [Monosiga brevicollis MX1]|eukprot:XP_001745008.1 hypothetical protein [Monosiga brevicollis MX1]
MSMLAILLGALLLGSQSHVTCAQNATEPPNVIRGLTDDTDTLITLCVFAVIWLTTLTFYSSRLLGWVVTKLLGLNRVTGATKNPPSIHIGSISFSIISGKIAFKNLRFITRDFGLTIVTGDIRIRYWRQARYEPAETAERKRLLIKLNGVRYHVYNGQVSYGLIAQAIDEIRFRYLAGNHRLPSHLFFTARTCKLVYGMAEERFQCPADAYTWGVYGDMLKPRVSAAKPLIARFLLRTVCTPLIPGSPVIRQLRIVPNASYLDSDGDASSATQAESDGVHTRPVSTSDTPREVGTDGYVRYMPTATGGGEEKRDKKWKKHQVLSTRMVKFGYTMTEPGLVANQEPDHPPPTWRLDLDFDDDVDIGYPASLNQQRAFLQEFFYPWDYRDRKATVPENSECIIATTSLHFFPMLIESADQIAIKKWFEELAGQPTRDSESDFIPSHTNVRVMARDTHLLWVVNKNNSIPIPVSMQPKYLLLPPKERPRHNEYLDMCSPLLEVTFAINFDEFAPVMAESVYDIHAPQGLKYGMAWQSASCNACASSTHGSQADLLLPADHELSHCMEDVASQSRLVLDNLKLSIGTTFHYIAGDDLQDSVRVSVRTSRASGALTGVMVPRYVSKSHATELSKQPYAGSHRSRAIVTWIPVSRLHAWYRNYFDLQWLVTKAERADGGYSYSAHRPILSNADLGNDFCFVLDVEIGAMDVRMPSTLHARWPSDPSLVIQHGHCGIHTNPQNVSIEFLFDACEIRFPGSISSRALALGQIKATLDSVYGSTAERQLYADNFSIDMASVAGRLSRDDLEILGATLSSFLYHCNDFYHEEESMEVALQSSTAAVVSADNAMTLEGSQHELHSENSPLADLSATKEAGSNTIIHRPARERSRPGRKIGRTLTSNSTRSSDFDHRHAESQTLEASQDNEALKELGALGKAPPVFVLRAQLSKLVVDLTPDSDSFTRIEIPLIQLSYDTLVRTDSHSLLHVHCSDLLARSFVSGGLNDPQIQHVRALLHCDATDWIEVAAFHTGFVVRQAHARPRVVDNEHRLQRQFLLEQDGTTHQLKRWFFMDDEAHYDNDNHACLTPLRSSDSELDSDVDIDRLARSLDCRGARVSFNGQGALEPDWQPEIRIDRIEEFNARQDKPRGLSRPSQPGMPRVQSAPKGLSLLQDTNGPAALQRRRSAPSVRGPAAGSQYSAWPSRGLAAVSGLPDVPELRAEADVSGEDGSGSSGAVKQRQAFASRYSSALSPISASLEEPQTETKEQQTVRDVEQAAAKSASNVPMASLSASPAELDPDEDSHTDNSLAPIPEARPPPTTGQRRQLSSAARNLKKHLPISLVLSSSDDDEELQQTQPAAGSVDSGPLQARQARPSTAADEFVSASSGSSDSNASEASEDSFASARSDNLAASTGADILKGELMRLPASSDGALVHGVERIPSRSPVASSHARAHSSNGIAEDDTESSSSGRTQPTASRATPLLPSPFPSADQRASETAKTAEQAHPLQPLATRPRVVSTTTPRALGGEPSMRSTSLSSNLSPRHDHQAASRTHSGSLWSTQSSSSDSSSASDEASDSDDGSVVDRAPVFSPSDASVGQPEQSGLQGRLHSYLDLQVPVPEEESDTGTPSARSFSPETEANLASASCLLQGDVEMGSVQRESMGEASVANLASYLSVYEVVGDDGSSTLRMKVCDTFQPLVRRALVCWTSDASVLPLHKQMQPSVSLSAVSHQFQAVSEDEDPHLFVTDNSFDECTSASVRFSQSVQLVLTPLLLPSLQRRHGNVSVDSTADDANSPGRATSAAGSGLDESARALVTQNCVKVLLARLNLRFLQTCTVAEELTLPIRLGKAPILSHERVSGVSEFQLLLQDVDVAVSTSQLRPDASSTTCSALIGNLGFNVNCTPNLAPKSLVLSQGLVERAQRLHSCNDSIDPASIDQTRGRLHLAHASITNMRFSLIVDHEHRPDYASDDLLRNFLLQKATTVRASLILPQFGLAAVPHSFSITICSVSELIKDINEAQEALSQSMQRAQHLRGAIFFRFLKNGSLFLKNPKVNLQPVLRRDLNHMLMILFAQVVKKWPSVHSQGNNVWQDSLHFAAQLPDDYVTKRSEIPAFYCQGETTDVYERIAQLIGFDSLKKISHAHDLMGAQIQFDVSLATSAIHLALFDPSSTYSAAHPSTYGLGKVCIHAKGDVSSQVNGAGDADPSADLSHVVITQVKSSLVCTSTRVEMKSSDAVLRMGQHMHATTLFLTRKPHHRPTKQASTESPRPVRPRDLGAAARAKAQSLQSQPHLHSSRRHMLRDLSENSVFETSNDLSPFEATGASLGPHVDVEPGSASRKRSRRRISTSKGHLRSATSVNSSARLVEALDGRESPETLMADPQTAHLQGFRWAFQHNLNLVCTGSLHVEGAVIESIPRPNLKVLLEAKDLALLLGIEGHAVQRSGATQVFVDAVNATATLQEINMLCQQANDASGSISPRPSMSMPAGAANTRANTRRVRSSLGVIGQTTNPYVQRKGGGPQVRARAARRRAALHLARRGDSPFSRQASHHGSHFSQQVMPHATWANMVTFNLKPASLHVRHRPASSGVCLEYNGAELSLMGDPTALAEAINHWNAIAAYMALLPQATDEGDASEAGIHMATPRVIGSSRRTSSAKHLVSLRVNLKDTSLAILDGAVMELSYAIPCIEVIASAPVQESLSDCHVELTVAEQLLKSKQQGLEPLLFSVPAVSTACAVTSCERDCDPKFLAARLDHSHGILVGRAKGEADRANSSMSLWAAQAGRTLAPPRRVHHAKIRLRVHAMHVHMDMNALNHMLSLQQVYSRKVDIISSAVSKLERPLSAVSEASLLSPSAARFDSEPSTSLLVDAHVTAARLCFGVGASSSAAMVELRSLVASATFHQAFQGLNVSCEPRLQVVDLAAGHRSPAELLASLDTTAPGALRASAELEVVGYLNNAHGMHMVTNSRTVSAATTDSTTDARFGIVIQVNAPSIYMPPSLIKPLVRLGIEAKASAEDFQKRVAGAKTHWRSGESLRRVTVARSRSLFSIRIAVKNASCRVPLTMRFNSHDQSVQFIVGLRLICVDAHDTNNSESFFAIPKLTTRLTYAARPPATQHESGIEIRGVMNVSTRSAGATDILELRYTRRSLDLVLAVAENFKSEYRKCVDDERQQLEAFVTVLDDPRNSTSVEDHSTPVVGAESAIYMFDLKASDGRPIEFSFHTSVDGICLIFSCEPDSPIEGRVQLPAMDIGISSSRSSTKLAQARERGVFVSLDASRVSLYVYHPYSTLNSINENEAEEQFLAESAVALSVTGLHFHGSRKILKQSAGEVRRHFAAALDVDDVHVNYDVTKLRDIVQFKRAWFNAKVFKVFQSRDETERETGYTGSTAPGPESYGVGPVSTIQSRNSTRRTAAAHSAKHALAVPRLAVDKDTSSGSGASAVMTEDASMSFASSEHDESDLATHFDLSGEEGEQSDDEEEERSFVSGTTSNDPLPATHVHILMAITKTRVVINLDKLLGPMSLAMDDFATRYSAAEVPDAARTILLPVVHLSRSSCRRLALDTLSTTSILRAHMECSGLSTGYLRRQQLLDSLKTQLATEFQVNADLLQARMFYHHPLVAVVDIAKLRAVASDIYHPVLGETSLRQDAHCRIDSEHLRLYMSQDTLPAFVSLGQWLQDTLEQQRQQFAEVLEKTDLVEGLSDEADGQGQALFDNGLPIVPCINGTVHVAGDELLVVCFGNSFLDRDMLQVGIKDYVYTFKQEACNSEADVQYTKQTSALKIGHADEEGHLMVRLASRPASERVHQDMLPLECYSIAMIKATNLQYIFDYPKCDIHAISNVHFDGNRLVEGLFAVVPYKAVYVNVDPAVYLKLRQVISMYTSRYSSRLQRAAGALTTEAMTAHADDWSFVCLTWAEAPEELQQLARRRTGNEGGAASFAKHGSWCAFELDFTMKQVLPTNWFLNSLIREPHDDINRFMAVHVHAQAGHVVNQLAQMLASLSRNDTRRASAVSRD